MRVFTIEETVLLSLIADVMGMTEDGMTYPAIANDILTGNYLEEVRQPSERSAL